MRYTTSYRSCSALLLAALLATLVQVHGYHRAAHDKCEEYHRSLASSNLGNCVETQRAQRYPHLAFFGWKKQDNPQAVEFLSIGNLISDRYLLAAALSTRYHQKPPDVVRFEVVDLGVEYQLDANDYEVAEVIAHPNYTRSLAYNDIALVKLREPLSFSVGIRPACLWGSLQMNFTSLVTMAFSSTGSDGWSQLEEFSMGIMDRSRCQKILTDFSITRTMLRDGVIDRQLCLAHTDDRQEPNLGNSGSPAQIKLDPKDCVTYIVGICSYGLGLGPEIYTRVASFVEWIEEIVWPIRGRQTPSWTSHWIEH